MIRKWFIRLLILAIAAAGIYYYLQSQKPSPEARYRLQPVTRGDVARSVSANGTLNPVTIVSVGTQVSGRVNKLYVDFNDRVEAGQVLLELDDSLLLAQIEQTTANIRNIEASVELAAANEARIRSLYEQEYVSRQELDQAVQALKSAKAQLENARAQLKRDKTNLGYSIIRSPVSGVVIDRIVDVGQTVAASFQTPELIRIAQDLSKMQIDSNFAEADIGSIREGQIARFYVDAFPNREFQGVVKQLRLNPTVTSNVVTYDVVISVDNPDEILLPGMTAYVSIEIERSSDALLVPNSALRFRPEEEGSDGPRGPAAGPGGKSPVEPGQAKVYILQNGRPTPVAVRTGITDGRVTEIFSDDLQPGDQVIVGDTLQQKAGGSTTMRFRMF
ncbi:MAG TPA: efflux RND transporter periplasmic adaptor subunit [Methylophilaceae bacterium]